jgi:hypothetical protein
MAVRRIVHTRIIKDHDKYIIDGKKYHLQNSKEAYNYRYDTIISLVQDLTASKLVSVACPGSMFASIFMATANDGYTSTVA